MIRDGINSSYRINALSMGAEVLYRRLMSVADDYGRFFAAPATIRGACWPICPEKFTDKQIAAWLDELCKGPRPLVIKYHACGAQFIEITEFGQQIRSKSKFPEPDSILLAECEQNSTTRRITKTETKTKAETEAAAAPLFFAISPSELNELWNTHRGVLPKATHPMPEPRREKAALRLKRPSYAAELKKALEICNRTPFLRGHNERGWKPDIDWFLANDVNIFKVLEGGRYGPEDPPPAKPLFGPGEVDECRHCHYRRKAHELDEAYRLVLEKENGRAVCGQFEAMTEGEHLEWLRRKQPQQPQQVVA